MEANNRPKRAVKRINGDPEMIVEGFEPVLIQDIEKHQALLGQTNIESLKYREAVAHEIKRKKYYLSLIGGGKFNDDSLRKSIDGINTNITHLSNKAKLAQDKIDHHKSIVDTLTKQLDDYRVKMQRLSDYRKQQLDAARD